MNLDMSKFCIVYVQVRCKIMVAIFNKSAVFSAEFCTEICTDRDYLSPLHVFYKLIYAHNLQLYYRIVATGLNFFEPNNVLTFVLLHEFNIILLAKYSMAEYQSEYKFRGYIQPWWLGGRVVD